MGGNGGNRACAGSCSCCAAVVFWALASCALAEGSAAWYFLPTGSQARDEVAQLEPDFDRKGWREVTFPHAFDRIQPGDNVFGWYVCVLRVPKALAGHDLVLDLGTFDDADGAYVNGELVGRTGSFADKLQSAWNQDRRYRVPAGTVRPGADNVIAVQVKDFAGNGGLLGQPHVQALLKVAGGTWRFQTGKGTDAWSAPDFDDSKWAEVPVPDLHFKKRVAALKGYSWYRLRFTPPEALRRGPVVLDLGPVYDACEIHLNGRRIGAAGRMPPRFIPATAARARVLVPDGSFRARNLLAVRVYHELSAVPKGVDPLPAYRLTRTQGGAGLPGYPAFDFSTPADLASARQRGTRAMLEYADLCVASGDVAAAAAVTDDVERAKPSGRDGELCLDLQMQLACLRGEPAIARSLLGTFVLRHPTASPRLSTVYLLHEALRGQHRLDATVAYLGADRQTKGNWQPLYGNFGYIQCAWNYHEDQTFIIWPGRPFKRARPGATGYKVYILDETDYARAWVGKAKTTDPRALALGQGEKHHRRYACWDDHGEVHPFDERGPDLLVDLDLPPGELILSFYLLDFDWYNGEHPRLQSILLFDRKSRRPLAFVGTGRFGEGVYHRFYLKGPRKITARINKHRSPCAVVSGVFLDRVPGTGDPRQWFARAGTNEARDRMVKRASPFMGQKAKIRRNGK